MRLRNLFWNEAERRLRAGWRIVLQFAGSVAGAALPLFVLGELLTLARHRGFLSSLEKENFDRLGSVLVAPIVILGLYWSLRLGARWIERQSFAVYGSSPDRRWWRELGAGLGFATLLMTLIFAVELLAGWVRVLGFLDPGALNRAASIGLVFTLVQVVGVGLFEEWTSRGVVQRNLAEGLTGTLGLSRRAAQAVAILLSSVLFSLLHWHNPNLGAAGLTGIFLIGVLLGTAYVTTGRLALPIGFHIAWNLMQGTVLGLPVSGNLEPTRLLTTAQIGPDLLTGGAFGPEAGLVAMTVVLLGIAVLVRVRRASAPTR